MIRLAFVQGSKLRKILIREKTVLMYSEETAWVPMEINLEQLHHDKRFRKLNEEEKKLLSDISKLNTEEEMARDVIKDFKKSGWRLFKQVVDDID